MRCPFLKEERVSSCTASPFRKMLPTSSLQTDPQRCTSTAYMGCAAARERLAGPGALGLEGQPATGSAQGAGVGELTRCPFLHESLAHWCAAAPVVKFIPYSDALLSRCNSDGHRHCLLFVQRAHPSRRHAGSSLEGIQDANARAAVGDAIPVFEHLAFAGNHMWLDAAEDGSCTVGVDAFLARVLGSVDQVSFASTRGVTRPSATLGVNGADLTLVFPNLIDLNRCNAELRARPNLLVEDPYGAGWLFEGSFVPPPAASAVAAGVPRTDEGLMRGGAAVSWMRRETDRLSRTIHELVTVWGDEALAMDGGIFARGVARQLEREERLSIFKEFFAVTTDRRL